MDQSFIQHIFVCINISVTFAREKLESKRGVEGDFLKRSDRRPMSWPTEEVTSGHPAGARSGVGSGPGAGPRANQMPAIQQSYLGFGIYCR